MKKVFFIIPMTVVVLFAGKIYTVEELEVRNDTVYEAISKKPAEGLLKIYFDHGELKTEVTFKNGKSSGIEKKFYPSGLLASSVPFHEGKENGVAKLYFESGALRFATPFRNGLKEGISKEYYPDGKLKSEIHFTQGEPTEGYKYLENGTRKSVPKELLKWIQPNTGLF